MAVQEPVLAIDDIQGDVLAGFRKDHVRLVFFQLRSDAIGQFKEWLAKYASLIASTRQVAGFNAVFKAMKFQMRREPAELSTLWRNIGFTAQGLGKLIGPGELARFMDASFLAGAEALSATLGDPTDGSLGDPATWVVGAGAKIPDGMVILAADQLGQLESECSSLVAELALYSATPPYIEEGQTRVTDPGHEHFGFKDGISQPAPRGRNPDGTYFIPRYLDPSDPLADYYAAPGQPLVWPGEFLLNGWRQKGANSDPLMHRESIDAPAWAANGSYLVFRRLRQDVGAFQRMIDALLAALVTDPAFAGITRDRVEAMVVGRFKSGCPVMRSDSDDLQLARDSYAANDFNFSTPSPRLRIVAGAPVTPNGFPDAGADRNGQRCPFGAHIRKVNPRDDSTDFGSGSNNLQRRILRRGIPYGPEYDPASPNDEDRGLLFLCYQSSIEDQFQTLVTDWVNGDHAPKDPSGFDPVISPKPNRQFLAKRANGSVLANPLGVCPVTATGSAFLFVPPISALRGRLANA